jgi:glycine hydroxymethyltransferase
VLTNARCMAQTLIDRGYKIVSGGTDNHLMLVDLIKQDVTGQDAEDALSRANITVNKNAVPNDPRPPRVTSGLRIGTPAITTRGFKEAETAQLTGWMADILDELSSPAELDALIDRVQEEVLELCGRYPVYA